MQDAAGPVSGDMQFDAGIFLDDVRDMLCSTSGASRFAETGQQRILLHLPPFKFSTEDASDGLQGVVQAVEHEVFTLVEETFGSPTAEGVAEDILQRRPVIGLPDEGERVDLGVEQGSAIVGDVLNCRLFGDEAAMRIKKETLLLPGLRDGDKVVFHNGTNVLGRCAI